MSENKPKIIYRERVIPGLAFFLTGLCIPAICMLIAIPFIDELIWLVPIFTYSAYLAFGFFMAPVITIDTEYLSVGNAQIPMKFIANATEIRESEIFAERGPRLDSAAYVRFQAGIKGLVRVDITDPSDPTPYWLIASRNPDLVTKFLNRN